MLCGRLRGGSPCWGQGGAGCGGPGVLVARALLALSPLLWLQRVCVVVLVVLWWAVLLLALGFRLWSGFGLGLRNWLEVEEDLVLEMWGEQCRVRLLLPGRWGRPRGSRGDTGRRIRGCGFGLAVAL